MEMTPPSVGNLQDVDGEKALLTGIAKKYLADKAEEELRPKREVLRCLAATAAFSVIVGGVVLALGPKKAASVGVSLPAASAASASAPR
jgi:hypothetical protein